MSRNWEQTFRNWSKPSSDFEESKCENAERMIRDTIKNSPALAKRTISIFAQGSYRNNTNVVSDSDVDVCICCRETFVNDYSLAPHLNDSMTGCIPATYLYTQFKNELEEALIKKFGSSSVSRGDKAFDIHANTYRVDADVVPALERRKYYQDGSYAIGTQIRPDSGGIINNWPEQHYKNGVEKNNRTTNRFKFITRAMKRLRNEMAENHIAEANPIPSYLIECLIYNMPDSLLEGDSYKENIEHCIGHIWSATGVENKCAEWPEVNGIKYLFHHQQKWTKENVNNFMLAAWNYINPS